VFGVGYGSVTLIRFGLDMFMWCLGLAWFYGRMRGWFRSWVRYVSGYRSSRAHYVKGLAYRVFLTYPEVVLSIRFGVCPFCGLRFKDGSYAYYHYIRKTRCSQRLHSLFLKSIRCDRVDLDLVREMFPPDVLYTYRKYASVAKCTGWFDGGRMLVNVFRYDRCRLNAVDVAYFVDCGDWRVLRVEGGDGRGELGQVQVQEVQ